jgi:hypothetical protein
MLAEAGNVATIGFGHWPAAGFCNRRSPVHRTPASVAAITLSVFAAYSSTRADFSAEAAAAIRQGGHRRQL